MTTTTLPTTANPVAARSHAGVEAYSAKNDQYFAGARKDYVDELPVSGTASILEIGCGNGDTGAYALASGKCVRYCGVELCNRAARRARDQISEVVVGDVEKVALPWAPNSFDVLIASEVLEHLVDPWGALSKLRPLLKKDAVVFSSSPNVSHHSVIRMLISGRWDLADKGVMDRTHLRWFTFRSYRDLFESSGFAVERVGPLAPLGPFGSILNTLTFRRYKHVFSQQVSLRARRR
jgi:SAM-dependent methyltransferase